MRRYGCFPVSIGRLGEGRRSIVVIQLSLSFLLRDSGASVRWKRRCTSITNGIIVTSRNLKVWPRLRSLRYGLRPGEIGSASVLDLTLRPCPVSSPTPRATWESRCGDCEKRCRWCDLENNPWRRRRRHAGQLPSSSAQTKDLT